MALFSLHTFADPIFVSVLTDILTNLASSKNDEIYKVIVDQTLLPLCLCIGSAKKEESWIPASAIDLVSSLVSGAPESGLGEGFFETLAPNLFSCLSVAEDRDVLQVRSSFIEHDLILSSSERHLLSYTYHSQRHPTAIVLEGWQWSKRP
jgi:hypothetical protein